MGDRGDPYAHAVDLRGLAVLLDAEIREVGVIDGDGERGVEIAETAGDEVPRLQRAVLMIGADQQHGGGAALGLAPGGEADDELLGVGDARCRQHGILLVADQQRGIIEALGAERHDPQVALRLVEHGGDHAFRTDIQAALHGDEHDGEDDTGERHDEAQAVVEEIPVGQLGRHLDGLRLALRYLCR